MSRSMMEPKRDELVRSCVIPVRPNSMVEAREREQRVKQQLGLEQRAQFARTYLANRDNPEFSRRLDPVLEYHLGLQKK